MRAGILVMFLLLAGASIALALWSTKRRDRADRATLECAVAAGLDEPPSLHPIIDATRCIGTKACVPACPEGGVLGVVGGRAALIEPTRCIGHGACYAACPASAIELVFGSARRGVEIPHVSPSFETNVPGLYIAGELGGMGLVRNAMEQGIEAVQAIANARAEKRRDRPPLDVVIVGCGPAGLAASLAAKQAGLRYVTLEQEAIGGTVYHYPREKMVITRPIMLPGYGTIRAREIGKEELLALWSDVIERTGVEIHVEQRVRDIAATQRGFQVVTESARYEAGSVVLAVGRRGSPRKLGVPGETSPTVTYALRDAANVRSQAVLVVGGGNTAVEAAVALAAPELRNHISLSYRRDSFARATRQNRQRLEELEAKGLLTVLRSSEVVSIEAHGALVRNGDTTTQIPADRVLVMIGGELPSAFLHGLGVRIDMKFGHA